MEHGKAKDGRAIKISPHEEHLAQGRERSSDPDRPARCRATRPKAERKIAHLMRRRHGGRRARVRGIVKIDIRGSRCRSRRAAVTWALGDQQPLISVPEVD
ncbi:transposase [Nonomuraea sp. CA-143628]|uniref:transposase n=1 Tax=Nonomuraea sp. CA-143628 TaxID=3239997 RepID=UPI003D90A964